MGLDIRAPTSASTFSSDDTSASACVVQRARRTAAIRPAMTIVFSLPFMDAEFSPDAFALAPCGRYEARALHPNRTAAMDHALMRPSGARTRGGPTGIVSA